MRLLATHRVYLCSALSGRRVDVSVGDTKEKKPKKTSADKSRGRRVIRTTEVEPWLRRVIRETKSRSLCWDDELTTYRRDVGGSREKIRWEPSIWTCLALDSENQITRTHRLEDPITSHSLIQPKNQPPPQAREDLPLDPRDPLRLPRFTASALSAG